jgi:hypothetical protein
MPPASRTRRRAAARRAVQAPRANVLRRLGERFDTRRVTAGMTASSSYGFFF